MARKRRRLRAFGALLAAALAVLVVTALTLGVHLGGSAASNTSSLKRTATRSAASKRAGSGIRVSVAVKPIGTLASAISAGSAVTLDSTGALFFGGLDSAATPLDEIQSFDGASTSSPGQLPLPLAGSAWITACTFTVLNAVLLTARLRCETSALAAATGTSTGTSTGTAAAAA